MLDHRVNKINLSESLSLRDFKSREKAVVVVVVIVFVVVVVVVVVVVNLAQECLSATAVTHLGCGCGNAFPKRYRTDRIPFDSLRPYQGHSLKSRDLGSSRAGFRQDLAIGTRAQQRTLRDQWQKKPCYSRKPSCVAASCQQDPS